MPDDIRVPLTLSNADINDPSSLDLRGMVRKGVQDEKDKIEAARKEAERAELRDKYSDIFELIDVGLPEYNAIIDDLFDKLVPSSGQSEIVAGELIRAINKIGYRWNNDGDMCFSGYGITTCGNAINYICSFIPRVESMVEQVADKCTGNEDADDKTYDDFLDRLYEAVVDFIATHPDEVLEPAEDMYSSDYDDDEWLKDLEPKAEIEVTDTSFNYELRNYIDDLGDYLDIDVYNLLSDFDEDVRYNGSFDNLERDYVYADCIGYVLPARLESEFYDFIESWSANKLRELEEEYGDYDTVSERMNAEQSEEDEEDEE